MSEFSGRFSFIRKACIAACASATLFAYDVTALAQQNGSGSPQHFVVRDSRNIGPNSVRFAAAQGTQEMPNIVLLGGDANIWPRIRSAVQEAENGGYPVRAILIGPPSEPPALEIYAHGHHVTNPIDPYRITKAELVNLIRDIHREYYPRR